MILRPIWTWPIILTYTKFAIVPVCPEGNTGRGSHRHRHRQWQGEWVLHDKMRQERWASPGWSRSSSASSSVHLFLFPSISLSPPDPRADRLLGSETGCLKALCSAISETSSASPGFRRAGSAKWTRWGGRLASCGSRSPSSNRWCPLPSLCCAFFSFSSPYWIRDLPRVRSTSFRNARLIKWHCVYQCTLMFLQIVMLGCPLLVSY